MTTRRTADRKFAFSPRPYTFEVSGDPLYNGVCQNPTCDGVNTLRPRCMSDETSDCRTRKLYSFADSESFTFTAHDLFGYVLGLALLKHDGSFARRAEEAKRKNEQLREVEAWNKTQLCGGVLMSNHEHLITTMGYGHTGPFKKALHGELAKSLPGLLTRGGVEPFASVWDARNPHDMILANAEAALSRHLYCVLNPMLGGLVSRIDEYPGFLIRAKDWGTSLTFKRPPFYFTPDKHPDIVSIDVVPPPALLYRWGGDLEALKRAVTEIEQTCERTLSSRIGERALGAAHLLEVDPWDRPKTPRDRRDLNERGLSRFAFLGERPPSGKAARLHPTVIAREQCEKEIAKKRSAHAGARLFERSAERDAWNVDDTRPHRKPGEDGKRTARVREAATFPYSTHKKRIEDEVRVAKPVENNRLIREYLDVAGNYLPYEDEVERTTEHDRNDALALAHGWMEERIDQTWAEREDGDVRSIRNGADTIADDVDTNANDADENDVMESRNDVLSDDSCGPARPREPRARRPDD